MKGKYEVKLEFSEGWGLKQKPSIRGGMGIFWNNTSFYVQNNMQALSGTTFPEEGHKFIPNLDSSGAGGGGRDPGGLPLTPTLSVL